MLTDVGLPSKPRIGANTKHTPAKSVLVINHKAQLKTPDITTCVGRRAHGRFRQCIVQISDT